MKLKAAMMGVAGLLSAMLLAAESEPQRVTTHTVNMGEGCRIRMQLPANSRFTVYQNFIFAASASGNRLIGLGSICIILPPLYEYEPAEAMVGLNCYVLTDDDYDSTYVPFDKAKKRCVKDMVEFVNQYPNVTLRERRALERVVRFQPLQAANASGYLYTNDDITGEEDRRVRHIVFGLVHKQRILIWRRNGGIRYCND